MPQVVPAAMPPDLDLTGGYTIRVTAIDASSGAALSTVNVSALAMQIIDTTQGTGVDLGYGPYLLVPGPGA